MKKALFLILACFFILPGIWGLQIEDRFFEIGLGADVNFSNDFLSINDVLKETFILDLDNLEKGFRMNLGIGVYPFYFNFDSKNGWGFGFSTHVQAMGIFDLSGKMLTFNETGNDEDGNSEISGAVFAEAAIPVNFSYSKFKIKIKPALFFPVLYATSKITYKFDDTAGGTIFNLGYDVKFYTPVSMKEGADYSLTATPGFDLGIGVEYPLAEALGLSDLLFFLDFDVGIDLASIPIAAGTMSDFMKMKGSIGSEQPVKLDDLENFIDDIGELENFNEKTNVYRPFKLLAYALWRPLGNNLITVTPSFGFAISPIYNDVFSMEAGIKGQLNLFNLLFVTLGTGYHDRLFKHNLDITLNVRAVELNIGAALCSPGFPESWNGSGFSVNAGLKFGW